MSARRCRPTRGQVLVIFAAALPALFGFLGLALDGGYYLAATRAAQFAAGAAARAAALDVQTGAYGSATSDGQAIGQRNLPLLGAAGTTIAIAYNNTAAASPTGAGWYTTTPSSQTQSVRATTTGNYRPLFLPLVGITMASIARSTVVTLEGGVLPLAVCSSTVSRQPNGPWLIYWDNNRVCGSSGTWEGFAGLDGQSHTCSEYKALVLPGPPTGRASSTTLSLPSARVCPTVTDQPADWLATTYYTNNPVQTIPVVDLTNSNRLVGCTSVRVAPYPGFNAVQASPQSSPAAITPCSAGMQETS